MSRRPSRAAYQNPKIGKHPDLYTSRAHGPQRRGHDPERLHGGETDVIIDDWRQMSPAELRHAAENGEVAEDDIAEMREYGEQARLDGDFEALFADGISRELAEALVTEKQTTYHEGKKVTWSGFIDELLDLDEKAREKRVEPLIQYIRDRANGHLEYEVVNADGEVAERPQDYFQESLENEHDTATETLSEAAKAVLEENDIDVDLGRLNTEQLEEILRDPGNFKLELRDGYSGRITGTVWAWQVGSVEDSGDGAQYEEQLRVILHGGEYRWTERPAEAPEIEHVETYPGLTDADVQYALKELENDEPYIYLSRYSRNKEASVSDFDTSYSYTIEKYADKYIVAYYDADRLKEAITGLAPVPTGPEHDNVAYTYCGTNDCVAGASSRGMYVAELALKDLRRESTALGHCLGSESSGHPRALREGRTKVYSIRTEAGKVKFTIELSRGHPDASTIVIDENDRRQGKAWGINEVKGKANRLPGFEPGKDALTKQDEVRLVTDFLLHLGFEPSAIRTARDTAPGVVAMEEAGIDPFSPPPKRERKPRANPSSIGGQVSARVRRLLERAYAAPMGAFRRR